MLNRDNQVFTNFYLQITFMKYLFVFSYQVIHIV